MTRRRILLRLIASRRAQSAGLVLMAAALALVSAFLLIGQENARDAQAESVRGFAGGGEQLFQPQNDAAEAAMAATGLAQPLWFIDGQIATGAAAVTAEVRLAREPLPLATLVSGRRPQTTSEVAVSVSVEHALSLELGDTVTISESGVDRLADVVGTTVDTGDADSTFVLALGTPVEPTLATWVARSSYDEVAGSSPDVAAALANRTLKPRTVDLLADDSVAATLSWMSESRTVLWPTALAGTALISATALAAMRGSVRRTVEALSSAGMPAREAARTVLGAATVLLYVGMLVGVVAAVAVSLALKDTEQQTFGQYWPSVTVPYLSLAGYVVLVPALAALLLAAVSTIRLVRSTVIVGRALYWLGAAVTGGAVLLWAAVYWQRAGVGLVRVACVLTIVGVAVLLSGSGGRSRGSWLPVHRTGTLLASRVALPSLVVAVGLAVLCLNAAHQTEGSEDLRRQAVAVQPPGSMVLFEVSADASRHIATAYEAAGGTGVVRIMVPLEEGTSLRVTSPGVGACMEEAGTSVPEEVLGSCSPDTPVPVNAIGLSAGDGRAVADPALVSDGQVGVLQFDALGAATVRPTLDVAAGSGLGGNLPGLVVPEDSAFATGHGLRPSGSEYLVLPDFSSLPEQQQARLRSTISRVAGAAQVSEDRGFDDGGRRVLGVAIVVGSTVGVFALWATCLGTFVASLRRFRRDVGLLGVRGGKRYVLAATVFGPAVVLQVVSALCVVLGAWLESGRSSHLDVLWLVPYGVALSITVAAALVAVRVPSRSYVD